MLITDQLKPSGKVTIKALTNPMVPMAETLFFLNAIGWDNAYKKAAQGAAFFEPEGD
jgi:hypothetical protein